MFNVYYDVYVDNTDTTTVLVDEVCIRANCNERLNHAHVQDHYLDDDDGADKNSNDE